MTNATAAPDFLAEEAEIRLGGGPAAIARQHDKGRLTARERVAKLLRHPRLVADLVGDRAAPTGGTVWGDSRLEIPSELAGRRWRCA